ncbi:MAG: HK97 family phage prohead protease [Negativicutes bacterium]|nr:HK97 family phage prohead protease [Negativicutes bacterium]
MGEKRKKETRLAEMRAIPQTDEQQDMIIDGYAIVFEQPTVLWTDPDTGKEYKEVISRGALDGVDLSDVPFKYNHSDSLMIMARSRNKTLILVPDDIGLRVSANLAPTTAGKDLYTLIQRGDINKMSFAFYVADDEYDRNSSTRRINKFATIGDVSAVDAPAYEQTSLSARSYCEGQRAAAELMEKEQQATEKRKQLLQKYFESRHTIPYVKTGTVDEPWDGPKMRANLNTGPDVKGDYYRQAFAWVDQDANPDAKGSYKFIHHDVSDGGAIGPANIKGCQSGIAVLNGSLGGSKIPGEDRQGVHEHLAAHLRDAKVEPDELRAMIDNACEDEGEHEDMNLRRKLLMIKTYL